MANRYHVNYEGSTLALVHVLPHPRYEGYKMISVIPVQGGDGLEGRPSQISLKSAIYGKFPDTEPEIEAVQKIIASAGFEPGKIEIKPAGP